MTTAAIYKRLSAKSKGQKNIVNLDTQEADCRKLADEIGATVIATFTEYGESAFDRDNPDDRPAYAELCDSMRRGEIDVIIAWHTDRLWRDDLEKALFIRDAQRAGLKLIVTKTAKLDAQNPDDEFMLSILTAVAKKETADKRRRIKSKMSANALAGKAHGVNNANRAFGYALDRVTIVPAEAEIVREISKRLLNGETLHRVARWVNSTGTTTSKGHAFGTTTVRDIAVSPRYAGLRAVGKREHAKVVAVAEWDAIIDRETSDRLRTLLLDPARRTNRSPRSYLLTGLLKCGRCAQPMFAHPRHGRLNADGNKQRFYACKVNPGFPARCGHNNIQAVELETLIGLAVAQQFVELAAAGAFEPEPDAVNDSVKIEVAKIDAKAAKLGADWAADRITDAAYYSASDGLVTRRAELSAMVRRQVRNTPPILTELAEHPERVVDAWENFSFDRKRTLIVALVERIEIAPPFVRLARGFDDLRVAIVWKTTTPTPA